MEPLSTWELEGTEEHKAILWKNEFASCGTWEFEGKEECNALYGRTSQLCHWDVKSEEHYVCYFTVLFER